MYVVEAPAHGGIVLRDHGRPGAAVRKKNWNQTMKAGRCRLFVCTGGAPPSSNLPQTTLNKLRVSLPAIRIEALSEIACGWNADHAPASAWLGSRMLISAQFPRECYRTLNMESADYDLTLGANRTHNGLLANLSPVHQSTKAQEP